MATKHQYHPISRLKKAYKKSTYAINGAKDKVAGVEESVKKYVKTNPWKTMGISLLAGALVTEIFHLRK